MLKTSTLPINSGCPSAVSPWQLGATLYVPALYPQLVDMALGHKYTNLTSMVVCLEDAVCPANDPQAIQATQYMAQALSACLPLYPQSASIRPLTFVRPRHPAMLKELCENAPKLASAITGWVLPKFNLESLESWWDVLQHTPAELYVMPTLETKDVFDVAKMTELANVLDTHPIRERILALRIGGNDLLSVLSLRRDCNITAYEGPLGYVLGMLTAVFATRGYALTSPVFEHIGEHDTLKKELASDRAYGFVGKTAIHPDQVDLINTAFRVTPSELRQANSILSSNLAVFKQDNSMCEPATHTNWANNVHERSQVTGVRLW